MKFRLRKEKGRVAGRHIEKDPKTGKDIHYEAGDTIDSERDLCEIFPGKFERVSTAEDFASPGQPNIIDKRFESPEEEEAALRKRLEEIDAAKGTEDDTPDDDNNDDKVEPSEYGKDITDEFPTATKIKAKVYMKSSWCTVVGLDPEDENDPVLNESKLRKKDVEAFLAEYLDDDSDDEEDDDNSEDDDNDED